MAQMPLARAQLGAQRKAGEREGKVSKLPRVGSWGGLGTGPKVWNQDLRTFQSAGVAAPTEGRALGFSGFLGGSVAKNPPETQETRVCSLGQEDPLEKEM